MIDLTKHVAMVTGAGTGLGRAMAIELTKSGMRVVGIGRRADKLAETVELAGSRFLPVSLDVGDPAAVGECIEKVSREVGFIGLLVNNAAVYPRLDFLEETPSSFMRSVSINLGGMVACSHSVLGPMVERGYGRILNVSTFADLAPIPASSAYSVSKGASRIFTRALVADICDRFPDIVINDWMPGILATDMGRPDGLDVSIAARWGVALALWHDKSLTGTIWERDTEQLPTRSLKGRLKDALLMTRHRPRVLS